MNPFLFFSGSRRLSVPASHAAPLFDLCLQYGLSYTELSRTPEGALTFRTATPTAKRLLVLSEQRGIPLTVLSAEGLPPLLFRLSRRAGLITGTLLGLCLLFLSRLFVWDVRITGNTTLTNAEILSELRACGFGVGSYLPEVTSGELETRVLISSDRIAWISVWLDGTVARVQVIEREAEEAELPVTLPANLIAASDGQIEYLELYRGQSMVTVGQAVKKGELLVSGLYDSQVEGYRYTRAAGSVYARTEHSFRVEIPLSYEKKCYSEPYLTSLTLNFFDFPVNFFKRGGNSTGTCDIIEKESDPGLPGGTDLPLSLAAQYAHPYTVETVTRTEEEALHLAYADLERRLAAATEGMQLLSKTVQTTLTDTGVILECQVRVIEDIARQSEFEVSETD